MGARGTSHRTTTGGRVELHHFWPEGGGRRMVQKLFEEFTARHPGANLTERANTLDEHGMLAKSRILQDDPPEVLVEWPGGNLAPYHEAGVLRDLTPLWEEHDWADAFIEGPRERCHIDGAYYGVPIDIHRMNNVFYHVEAVEECGVDPETVADPREFLEVLRQCGGDDRIGMTQPMKNPSDVLQLFANVLIGQFGAEVYAEITGGRPAAYESELHEAVEILAEFAALAGEDATFVDMIEANDRFVAGDAVFYSQGDWMAGTYAEQADFAYGTDWDRANFPGTDDAFMLSNDAIVVPANAHFGEMERAFVAFMASPTAQELLNRIKGSIPPRTDVPLDEYPAILREQHRDFTAATHFPAGHALQVTPETFVEAKIAASEFIQTRDVAATTAAFVEAYG